MAAALGAQSQAQGKEPILTPQQQQQWLWQQQLHAMQFLYGNFIPNYNLGGGLLETHWKEEQEELPEGRITQVVHEMSEEEEEESGVEDDSILVVPQKGKTADLMKEQLAVVKDCDKIAQDLDQDLAGLLDRYLKDDTSVAEMENFAKSYLRVGNSEWMKVPRLDEEVFQLLDLKHRGTDQAIQGIQRALMASKSALSAVLQLGFKKGVRRTQSWTSWARTFWTAYSYMLSPTTP